MRSRRPLNRLENLQVFAPVRAGLYFYAGQKLNEEPAKNQDSKSMHELAEMQEVIATVAVTMGSRIE